MCLAARFEVSAERDLSWLVSTKIDAIRLKSESIVSKTMVSWILKNLLRKWLMFQPVIFYPSSCYEQKLVIPINTSCNMWLFVCFSYSPFVRITIWILKIGKRLHISSAFCIKDESSNENFVYSAFSVLLKSERMLAHGPNILKTPYALS